VIPRTTMSLGSGSLGSRAADRWTLFALVLLAIVLRVVLAFERGPERFATEGYTFYQTIAANLLAGDGFCYEARVGCAIRMPVYPMWLAAAMSSGAFFLVSAFAQSLLGGAIVYLAWYVGRVLFNSRVGLLAGAATALNPYAAIHDTAMQDTVVLNALMLAAVASFLRSQTGRPAWTATGATLLSLATLTSARVAVFAPLALLWVWRSRSDGRRRRLLYAVVPLMLLVGGWMGRNAAVAGAPVLTTEGGEALYFGNSDLTFRHFPRASIDLTSGEIETLPLEVQSDLARLQDQGVALDAYYRQLAVEYAISHPGSVAMGALRKLWVVVSAELSPARAPLLQVGYRVVFLPVYALALVAAWRVCSTPRGRWEGHALIALLVAAFAVTTAAFWAHTSHKSYLDPVCFIYAAAAVTRWNDRETTADAR